ncbi:sperm-associated antigen 8 isoform X3 [Lithobates pipiens]
MNGDGHAERHGHRGILTTQLLDQIADSTTHKDSYRKPISDPTRQTGRREEMIRRFLYQQFRGYRTSGAGTLPSKRVQLSLPRYPTIWTNPFPTVWRIIPTCERHPHPHLGYHPHPHLGYHPHPHLGYHPHPHLGYHPLPHVTPPDMATWTL